MAVGMALSMSATRLVASRACTGRQAAPTQTKARLAAPARPALPRRAVAAPFAPRARRGPVVTTAASGSSSPAATLTKISNVATALFPVWVAAGCATALVAPAAFAWFKGSMVPAALALTMMAMGVTLSVEDFQGVMQRPRLVFIGFVLQYTIMPLLGLAVSHLCGLPPSLAAGVVLVACCPGGTASNIVTFLAGADVALSVLMTTASTLGAPLMTPLLTKLLLGSVVEVNAAEMFVSTIQVVLLPVLLGASLKHYLPRAVAVAAPAAPLVAVVAVALICASVIAANATTVLRCGPQLLAALALLHSGGFAIGYGVSKFGLRLPETVCRTNAIETGMQNSALGAVLARLHFANPLTAAPCAVSACLHSVLGSALAAYWAASDRKAAARAQAA